MEKEPQERNGAHETVIIDQDAATTESLPCPLTSESQRPGFQFNTGLDQISLIAQLRHIFDTFTLEAQLSTD